MFFTFKGGKSRGGSQGPQMRHRLLHPRYGHFTYESSELRLRHQWDIVLVQVDLKENIWANLRRSTTFSWTRIILHVKCNGWKIDVRVVYWVQISLCVRKTGQWPKFWDDNFKTLKVFFYKFLGRPLSCKLKGAFSLRASTRDNTRERVLHIHEPTNQSVLRIWIGHFDWLAHEYAIRVHAR